LFFKDPDDYEVEIAFWRWILDAHKNDGKRYIIQSDELLSAFPELEASFRRSNTVVRRGLQSTGVQLFILFSRCQCRLWWIWICPQNRRHL
jgi:hypothetical protein